MKLPKLVSDLFTGPDGVTWAIGRVYSLPMLATGLAVPFVQIVNGQHVDLTALGLLYGGLGVGVWTMIRGTNATEPAADGELPPGQRVNP